MVKSGSVKIRKKRASDADLESSAPKNKKSKSKKPTPKAAAKAATTTMANPPDDNLAKIAKLVNTKAKKAQAKENKAIAQQTAGKKKAKGTTSKPQHQPSVADIGEACNLLASAATSLADKKVAAGRLKLLARKSELHREAIEAQGGIDGLIGMLTSATSAGKIKTTAPGMDTAAAALSSLAFGSEVRRAAITDGGALAPLATLLASGTDMAKSASASTLLLLANGSEERCNAIAGSDGTVTALVGLVTAGNADAKQFATGTLWNLAVGSDSRCTAIVAADAVGPLLTLVGTGHTKAKEEAARCLGHLAAGSEDRAKKIDSEGGATVLTGVLLDATTKGKTKVEAVRALQQIANGSKNRCENIAAAGAVPPLVAMLGGASSAKAKEASVTTLLALVERQSKLGASVKSAGAQDNLKALAADKDAKGAEQAAALLKLLK